jgi:hypothetical protein
MSFLVHCCNCQQGTEVDEEKVLCSKCKAKVDNQLKNALKEVFEVLSIGKNLNLNMTNWYSRWKSLMLSISDQ